MWAVDLAPQHKLGLPLATRVILAPGMSRLGWRHQIVCELDGVGAVVTGPWTWEPHWGRYPTLVSRPGGVVWTPERVGRPVAQLLAEVSTSWEALDIPVLACIAPGEMGHVQQVARHLADVPTVAGVWLETREDEDVGHVLARIDVARRASELPVLVALPLSCAGRWARPCVHAGADALVVGMPLEGELPHQGRWVRGRVYGPLMFPVMLAALRAVAAQVEGRVPLIAHGGIHTPEDAVLCREVGADAVALDAVVWVAPDMPRKVWQALQQWELSQQEGASHASGRTTG